MKPPRLRFLPAAAMSSRSSHRASGRNQWHRPFSHRPGDPNLGFRPHPPPHNPPPPHHGQLYNAVPPPPYYGNQTFRPPPQQHDERNFSHRQGDSNLGFCPHLPPLITSHSHHLPRHEWVCSDRPPPPYYGNQTFRPQPRQNDERPYYGNQNFRPLQNQWHAAGPYNRSQDLHPQAPQFGSPRVKRSSDYRSWESSKSEAPHHFSVQFKILSYNLLADYLAINHRSKLYFHIPWDMLSWNWRKRSIIFELNLWSADILCFQEVDRFQDLEEDLKLQGYSGIWKMRTGDPLDGCAIFWRDSRFKLLHEEFIEYNKLGLRDNVAQICVFELLNQNHDQNLSDSPRRLPSPNRVVVCNIHVLYNPRRGEIKLGQVRVLLDRAHDVSKLWDNAPVVLCGDFNCTPKSPLYNYISEQKLNLSGLPRDKVSGQASADIRPQWQYGSNNRAPRTADHRSGATNAGVVPSVNCSPRFTSELKISDNATMVKDCSNKIVLSPDEIGKRETHKQADSCGNEAQSAFPVSSTGLEKPSSFQDRVDLARNLDVDSFQKGIFHSSTPEASDSPVINCEDEPSIVVGHSENSISVPAFENSKPNTFCEVDVCPESTLNIILNEKMENLSLDGLDERNEGDEILGEDSSTFLAELHDEKASVSNVLGSGPVSEVSNPYDPSAWTPMEIEGATGSADCTLMEHSLKLKSSYTEVEDSSGTRDSHGEPLVTSYNRCFMGTVDYIWRSEGLKTVRVLAPLPKPAMQWTSGFPTKKWGSDHIALVSELAFTNDPCTQNTESS